MSSWQEYKKKMGTSNSTSNNSVRNSLAPIRSNSGVSTETSSGSDSMSSWQRYKAEQQQKAEEKKAKAAQEEEQKKQEEEAKKKQEEETKKKQESEQQSTQQSTQQNTLKPSLQQQTAPINTSMNMVKPTLQQQIQNNATAQTGLSTTAPTIIQEVTKDNNIKTVQQAIEDGEIKPVEKKWYQKFFKTPETMALGGNTIANIPKTVGSTILHAGSEALKGAYGVIEGITDLEKYGLASGSDLQSKLTAKILAPMLKNKGATDEQAEALSQAIAKQASNETIKFATSGSPLGGKDGFGSSEELRESAQEDDFENSFMGDLTNDFRKESVLGDTSEKVAQAVGYTAALALSGGTGASTEAATTTGSKLAVKGGNLVVGKLKMPVLAGTTAASQSLNDTYTKDPDASDGVAWTRAIGSGFIEMGTEGIFGMFGAGGSSVDDYLVGKASEKFSSSAGKILAQNGVKATGESAEEVLGYVGNQLLDLGIDKATGSSLKDDWDWSELGESMAVAAISTGVSQGGSTTFNLGKEANTRIAEVEKTEGRELTNKEKSHIVKEVAYDYANSVEKDALGKQETSQETQQENIEEPAVNENVQQFTEQTQEEQQTDTTETNDIQTQAKQKAAQIMEELNQEREAQKRAENEQKRIEIQNRINVLEKQLKPLQAQIEADNTANNKDKIAKLEQLRNETDNDLVREAIDNQITRLKTETQEILEPKPASQEMVENEASQNLQSITDEDIAPTKQETKQNTQQENKPKQQVLTEEEYLSQNGYPFMGYSEAGLHKTSQNESKRSRQQAIDYVQNNAKKYDAKRAELRKEYQQKVANGEIRQPTTIERALKIAQGLDERSDVQAARRLLEKRGIDWKTGESIEKKQDTDIKTKQLNIIQKSNPMADDYHTGIRSIEDIKTLEETLRDPDWSDYNEFNPDLTKNDIEQAIKSGKITVYSSNPIEQGTFISPSRMEAESYSGDGKIYSKEVNIDDIAWIDPTQGQYAKVNKSETTAPLPNVDTNENYEDNSIQNDVGITEDTTDINTRIKDTFDLSSKEAKELYSKVANADSVEQVREVLEDYKDINEKVQDEEVKAIRKVIRNTKLDVSNVKAQITDYNQFRKNNFGNLKIGNDGMSVDSFYQELVETHPDYFDSDVTNVADQLEAITDFMNNNKTEYTQKVGEISNEDLNDLANELYAEVHAKEYNKYMDMQGTNRIENLEPSLDQEQIKQELSKEVQSQVKSITAEIKSLKSQLKDIQAPIKEAVKELQQAKEQTTNIAPVNIAENTQEDSKTYYHGTRGNFETFDNSKIGQNYEGDWASLGKGFYFTEDYNSAKEFGKSSINDGEVTVKEAKLNIKNPFYVDDFTQNDAKTINQIKSDYGLQDSKISNGYNLIDELKRQGVDTTEALKKYGYDGIIAEDEVMVFDANQIKPNTNTAPIKNVTQNTAATSNNTNIAPITETNETMNPAEILNLTQEDANTTPKLPNIPVETGGKESSFYKNITETSQAYNEDLRNTIANEDDVKYYKGITNEQSLAEAQQRLDSGGTAETMRWLTDKWTAEHGPLKGKQVKQITATDVAEGWILLKRYQDAGDYEGAVQVAKKMREMGTTSGQAVQAFNIMERLTPEGMTKYAQSELSEAFEHLSRNQTKKWIDSNRANFDLTGDEAKFIADTMKDVQDMDSADYISNRKARLEADLQNATDKTEIKRIKQELKLLEKGNTEYLKKAKIAEIQQMMADKIPPTAGKSIKAWMRISMLFNPKTQVRNVLGNAIIMPVNFVSDMVSTGIDKAISAQTGVRTKGLPSLKASTKGFGKGIAESVSDYRLGINTREMTGDRFEIKEGKNFTERTAIGKTLNRIDNLNSFMLDAGDRGFYELAYQNSIDRQLKLNNTDTVTQDMINIATNEALERTWQDNNNYTRAVLNVRESLNKIGIKDYGLGDVLIPFAKTPANLTKAIIDYSPAGVVNAITDGVKLSRSLENGQFDAQMQHKFVQSAGKATAGTMLYILGYALAEAGITSGGGDDDKDAKSFMKNVLGVNDYSIEIGGHSFTYDWAQPVAAPFAITADIYESKKENKDLTEAIMSSLNTAGNLILEQSFMDSINSVLTNNEGIVSGLQEAILDLPARAIPTFSKQIADMIDGTTRQQYVAGKPLESAKNSILAKIPFASQTLAPSVNTLGNEIQKYGGENTAYNVFFNPSNVNANQLDEAGSEIYRVYQETKDVTVMPKVAPYSAKKDGETVQLTSEQRAEFQKRSGSIVESNVNDLLSSKTYEKMSEENKAKVLTDIVNYAYNKAQSEIVGTDLSDTYKNVNKFVDVGGTVDEYYTFTNSVDNTDKNTKKTTVVNTLLNMNMTDQQKAQLYDKYYSSEETLNELLDKGVRFNSYLKYDKATYNMEKDSEKIKYLKNSNIRDVDKAGIYETTILSDFDNEKKYKDYKSAKAVNVDIDTWLDFSSQDFKADKNSSGKTISNSRKEKVVSYINNLNIDLAQKAVLLKGEYSSDKTYNNTIVSYVNSLDMTFSEKKKVLENLNMTVSSDGTVSWK